ncbi:hypothetical protein AJ80_05636 [Polytolypa hystricis UAMH7299]|uniref:Altered inheritance of mitochondria protein 9, mitochondrial n=1 Tax=Polytolypa hystricis (strain UAMH7299) TaxID=1447883 RepID=A0A2B7Y2L3_POLH7|nr:hypothetical protein AJ80_05636 [Polytolypa hystricis UAMH7299]
MSSSAPSHHGGSLSLLYFVMISDEFVDANWDDKSFHHYTNGRWLFNESKQLAARSVMFNMTELIRTAAASQGCDISSYINVQKLPEGSFNKAFLIILRDGQQVIAKVPNPNAGLPFYTTASEVATMDFVGTEYSWSANTENMCLECMSR